MTDDCDRHGEDWGPEDKKNLDAAILKRQECLTPGFEVWRTEREEGWTEHQVGYAETHLGWGPACH